MSVDYVIIDGNSTFHRMHYAYSKLSTQVNGKKINTGMLYGTIKNLIHIKYLFPDAEIYYTFDSKKQLIKKEMYAEYKANRKPKEEDFINGSRATLSALILLGYQIAVADGYEADDVINTLTNKFRYINEECKIVIITSDKDMWQLVSKGIRIMRNKRKDEEELVTRRYILDNYGIKASKWLEMMCLTGCEGDNVPGIPGIGDIKAIKLIQTYENIENILKNIENIAKNSPKMAENLKKYGKIALNNRNLLKLLEIPEDKLVIEQVEADLVVLKEMFEKLSFRQYLLEENWKKIERLAVK